MMDSQQADTIHRQLFHYSLRTISTTSRAFEQFTRCRGRIGYELQVYDKRQCVLLHGNASVAVNTLWYGRGRKTKEKEKGKEKNIGRLRTIQLAPKLRLTSHSHTYIPTRSTFVVVSSTVPFPSCCS